jgi:large subunit ribosomal protein L35
MPKLKTHSGAKDRIKVTKTGKLIHGHVNRSHFLQKKSASRKRRIASPSALTGKTAKAVKRKLGV